MKKTSFCNITLVFLYLSFPFFANADITTTLPTTGEDIVWSIDTIPDSQIEFIRYDSAKHIHYYRAPLLPGQHITVRTAIPTAKDLISAGSSREIKVSIPDAGTRWVAKKTWSDYYDGLPSPASVTLDHRAPYNPYQRVPPYESYIQLDKWIEISDFTFQAFGDDKGAFLESIIIYPLVLIGYANSEDNGLPKHARTEPDYKIKKPYGCNGCSEMGLPGYRVNMATLLPVIQDTLFQWDGLGPGVSLALTWNARQGTNPTDFGSGWKFSYDAWLEESADGVIIRQGDGTQLHFEIPGTANANITSIVTTNGDREVTLEYDELLPWSVPNYENTWDGKFDVDRSGYRLEKTIGGDPSSRTFTMTPPNQKFSYIFQGASGTTDPIPLIAVEDWNGNRVSITRHGDGSIASISDPSGRTVVFTYNLAGQCTALTIPGGKQLHFSYDGSTLVKTVDLIANQTDYTYNADQNITKMDTEGRAWLFNWTTTDDIDHLSSVIAPGGGITEYSVQVPDAAYMQTKFTDESGRDFTYNYSNGSFQSNTRQQSYRIVSDEKGRPVEIYQQDTTNPRTLKYDSEGNLTRVTEFDAGVHTYTYNARGQVTQYIDALGNTWLTEYDPSGNKIRSESPAGRVRQYVYSATGQLIQSIDPMGNSTRWTYDSFGNIRTITDALGAVTTFSYDSHGFDVTSVRDALGHVTSFTHDANRRQHRTTHPDGTFKEALYDCCATTGFRNENGDTRFISRSPSLEILSESDYLGNTVSYIHDAAGRLTNTVNPLGKATTTSYNASGHITAVKNALGDSTSWQYDSRGDLGAYSLSEEPIAQVPINMNWRGVPVVANNVWIKMDKMGRLNTSQPLYDYSRTVIFTRDSDGLLTEKSTNSNGNITTLATYTRDLNGAVTASTHPLGSDSYIRNARGQVTKQTWFNSLSAWFTYDTMSHRLSRLKYPDGSVAEYTYDSRGRITDITWKGQTLQMQYDGVGNILQETRSNGIDTSVSSDKNSLPIRINHHSSTETLFDLRCSRNKIGSISSCSKTGTTGAWSPALTGESTSTQYKYDRSFTIDKRHGWTASTDVSGNQATIPGPRAFNGSYDFQNLLSSWNTNSSNNTVVYDGQNRMVQWTRNGTVRRFHYDTQDRLLFETDTANTITAMWLYRGKQVVAMADSNGVYFYHNDLSANISFLSDESGKIVASYRYLPFGLQAGSVSNIQNPFTFVGSYGVLDLDEGLYYMRSRTYDAMTQAFLSNDPLGLGVTTNAREYANNNPLKWIDPDGRSSCQSGYSLDGVAESYQFSADQVGEPYQKEPHYTRRYRSNYSEQGTTDSMKCATSTLESAVGSMRSGGTEFSAYLVTKKLAQGKYVDAAFDAGAMAIGKANPIAGAMTTFMGASQMGNGELSPEQRKTLQQCNYHNKKEAIDFGDFTIPEFTLD